MISFVVTLALIAAIVTAGFGLQQLVSFVRGDGATQPRVRRTPPASHHADPFDPRSRLA
jgi:hypothetical protein